MKTTIIFLVLMLIMLVHYIFAGPVIDAFVLAIGIMTLMENIYIRARWIISNRKIKKMQDFIDYLTPEEWEAIKTRQKEESKPDGLRKNNISVEDGSSSGG